MSRLEFMKQLARLLDDLPREEKIEILKYYNGYFDDAGVENEADIIAQLGSPEKVAAEVKAGMEGDFVQAPEDARDTEMSADVPAIVPEMSEENKTKTEKTAYQYTEEPDNAKDNRKNRNPWKTVAIVAIVLVTFPFWISLLGTLLGLGGGLIGILVGGIGALIGAIVGLVGGVIGCIVSGVILLATAPLTGIFSLAVGIFLVGVLLLVGLLVGLLFGKLFPAMVKGIGKLAREIKKAITGIWEGLTGRR